jgi:4'-phosphopantetheinyl transferase
MKLHLALPDPFPDLPEDEAHVWKCALSAESADLTRQYALLSDDEQKRADQFKIEPPRRQFIIARSTLRSLLGRYLKTPPVEISFCTAEHGKPGLLHPAEPLEFNVSHSHDLILFAFARNLPVGIDVEWLGRNVAHVEVAARFFSERELSQLNVIPSQQRPLAFLECWTRKEAYLKARGSGLSRDPRTFSVSLTGNLEAALLEDQGDPPAPHSWSIQPIHLGEPSGYCAALAIQSPPGVVKCHCFW